jgi:hypothetical protein
LLRPADGDEDKESHHRRSTLASFDVSAARCGNLRGLKLQALEASPAAQRTERELLGSARPVIVKKLSRMLHCRWKVQVCQQQRPRASATNYVLGTLE